MAETHEAPITYSFTTGGTTAHVDVDGNREADDSFDNGAMRGYGARGCLHMNDSPS